MYDLQQLVWAIAPHGLARVAAVLAGQSVARASGDAPAPSIAAGGRKGRKVDGAVAVIPIRGEIVPRAGTWVEALGGISCERIAAWTDKAMSDPGIGAIVYDVDSPGGMVEGVPEVAQHIAAYRGKKPMVAVANHSMTSAAYWIASAADEIIASPSSQVGSIGVVAVHADYSKAFESMGINVTIATAGRRKAEWNPYQPLDEEARTRLDQMLSRDYDLFVGAVAKNRDMTRKDVLEASMEARVLTPGEALAGGLIDRIADMTTVLSEFSNSDAGNGRSSRAALAALAIEEFNNCLHP